MDDKISNLQEIQILLAFIKNADKDGAIDFDKTNIWSEISKVEGNGNRVDSLLYKLNEAGVICFEEIGEDGFKPITMASISERTHIYLSGLVQKSKDEYESLENRITEILTFNPNVLSNSILETKRKLEEVDSLINGNELLKPISQPLNEIRHHFESVSAVSSNYEDIYKNIIRPVQEEGRSGVRATVKWAVISIILSMLISLSIGNWNKISELLSSS